jgi:DNA mismatch repair ATPase MutS
VSAAGKMDIHLVRIGDFYEAEGSAAVLLGNLCGASVTARRRGEPVAGIPVSMFAHYAECLNRAGHWVVVVPEGVDGDRC